ncbi:hypothetical protein EKO27_g5268 [Xylaria grammica]|uniref:Uncharacterized protein n=1 Tax=Xylaria grammica TaxID=363999 RepID=A0A439D611_9PEZI|nr:hypothetical protein EKO27_g5268 [Xylaria grammica]
MAVGESGTLTPLPPVVRSGSIAIVIFALASFFAALLLFLYLTYNVIRWRLGGWTPRKHKKAPGHMFANGPIEFGPAADAAKLAGEEPTIDAISLAPSDQTKSSRYPNQFIVLFLNLLIADVHQATAFSLSTSWIIRDSVAVGTGTCFVQGLFVSVGDLASSCFMSAIAIHTFYSIVWKYRPPHKTLYIYILLIWVFIYLISLLPVAGTLNGAAAGGFFVRAGPWCWVNKEYGDIPIGRVLTMARKEPSLGYFCASGALVASNGWLDVVVFTTTRRSIVFAHGEGLGREDTGVDTFTFMTPNTFGNTVWVRGGHGEQPRKPPTGGWWRILGDPETQARRHSRSGKSLSQTSLTLPTERNAIQMEVITTVVVEDDRSPHRGVESTSISTQSLKERPYQ